MENIIQLALEERNGYIDKCKELIVKEIGKLFRAVPLCSRIEFFMDLPNIHMTYRDNPLISHLTLFTSQSVIVKTEESDRALGDLNLVMHLCGIGLINLFPCGKVVLQREHYIT